MEQTSKLALEPDAFKRLTEKMNEMMGNDATQSKQLLNERGEPLNEDGLPIVEITEPIQATANEDAGDAFIPEDVSPVPLSSLTTQERHSLRQERDRILDQLEEEETFERQERRLGFEEKQEILRKRKEAAAAEKEKLQAAKLTQKRMGKALLRTMSEGKADEAEFSAIQDASNSSQDEKPSRKVTFADDLAEQPPHSSVDWGDLTPGRLRSTRQPSLLSSSEKLPMKMVVVERQPQAPLKTAQADSDDDSNPESPEDGTDDEDDISEQELTLEDDELDLDTAQHHREVALKYYEKREEIRAAALTAVSSDTADRRGGESSALPKKLGLSQFKASRLASSYNVTTTLQTEDAVNTSAARILQKSIRKGKLDPNGQLIGGDLDSASEGEYDEGTQEMMKLLREGELYNVGLDGEFVHAASTSTPGLVHQPSPTSHVIPSISGLLPKDVPARGKSKSSKFKLSRVKAGRPSADTVSPSQPPTSEAPHSSHEAQSVTTPAREAPVSSNVTVNRNVPKGDPTASAADVKNVFSSMIVDSPSFPYPTSLSTSPGFSTSKDSSANPTHSEHTSSRPSRPPEVISSTVRETNPVARTSDATQTHPAKTGKVSRFMAERR